MKKAEEILRERGVKPSINRLKILNYLLESYEHPTVDSIYKDLVKELPTLSKTTVYNTLKILAEYNIVNEISIEGNELRYDIALKPHGHFKCLVCNEIIDFDIDIDKFDLNVLDEVDIKSLQFYIKGKCKKCKNK